MQEGEGAGREKYIQWKTGGQTDRKKRGGGYSI